MPGYSKYDFVFSGAGCAALSLVMRMIKSGKFADKKILMIDKEPKTKNDRTWCFWEKKDGFFDEIVYKKWDSLSILSDEYTGTMKISPYQYKMIRGIDFYNYCFSEIEKHSNVEIVYGNVRSAKRDRDGLIIDFEDRTLYLDFATVFNSFFTSDIKKIQGSSKHISLLQHFKGWIIETPVASFDPAIATFMDFRIDQKRGTTFAYVLPFSETRALVEYTLFSKDVLENEVYENELSFYIKDLLKISDYKIIEEEFGVIPMTTKKFDFYRNYVYHIGTIGGQTKASTGYTFQFIQKQAEVIIDYLIRGVPIFEVPQAPYRFRFYDKVLLDVLDNKRVSGKQVFTTLFKKNKAQQVLKFLDNESSLVEELKVISTLPKIPFLKAAINQF